MDASFVVTGGRKNIKKQPKNRPLPEIFVEREDNNNLRYRSDLRHSTPYYNQRDVQDIKKGVTTDHHDSGYADWSASSSRYEDVSNYAEVSANDSTFWSSISSPVLDLKKKFKSRQTFVDERPNIKFDAENLVKVVVMVVLFSSIMFSVFMGMSLNDSINGKLRSVKYGTEKKFISLKNNSRIIDYDIKDEFGNVLGGKRAAIQFAYNMMYKSQPEVVKEEGKVVVEAAMEASVEEPKIAETEVEEPVSKPKQKVKREYQQMTIYEISERIEELTNLLAQDDLEDDEDFDLIEKEIKMLRLRKRSLIKKLQNSEQGKPVKARSIQESSNDAEDIKSKATVETKTVGSKKVKPAVSEAGNPLGVPKKPKQSKRRKNAKAAKAEEKSAEDDIEKEGGEDEDYPDDPTFRGKEEM